MNTPKISVIVPIYNVEQYLPKCIDSVLSSVEQDFEILLIDDGSTDNSGKICDDYEEKDNRIIASHNMPNEGLSAARNRGLDIAKGNWIFFLDSDDYIDENELTIPEELNNMDIITKSNVVSLYGIADGGRTRINKREISGNGTFTNDTDIWGMFINSSQFVQNSVWAKLYRRDLIGQLHFDLNATGYEDFVFSYAILKKIHKYAFSNIGTYYYLQRSSSLAHTNNEDAVFKLNLFFDNDHIKDWSGIRPIYTRDTIRNLSTWILHHKYINLLTKERLTIIHKFLLDVTEPDCLFFIDKDYIAIEKIKHNLALYTNNSPQYKFVILRENLVELKRHVKQILIKIIKAIYFKK